MEYLKRFNILFIWKAELQKETDNLPSTSWLPQMAELAKAEPSQN